MSKFSWPALLVVTFGAQPARAQVKLEWQFKKGDTFFAERVYTQNQSVAVKNKMFKEQRTKTWLTAVTCKEKIPGGYVLDLKVEFVGGFDDKLAGKLKGSLFTITVTPLGKVTKFEGYDALIQKLADKNGELERMMKAVLAEEVIRADLEDFFHILPKKPVRKGEKWRREAVEPVPPFGSFLSSIEYVLEDDKGSELGIGSTIKMTYKPPSEGGDLFRVIKGGLKAEEGKGTIVFDAKRGRLVRSEKNVVVHGELVIESMGIQSKMEFTSENTLRGRVFTKDEANKD